MGAAAHSPIFGRRSFVSCRAQPRRDGRAAVCAAAQARSQAGSKIGVEYSLPPERDDGYRRGPSKVYATVPQGTVATTVASDWLANELAEHGEIDAAYRDRIVMHLMTAAGASAPADAVFRFTAGEAMQTEDDDEDADQEYSDDGRASDL